MPFNSGYRGKRANDTQGTVGPQSQFLQKTFPKPYITGYTISGIDDTALNPAGGQTVLVNGGNFATGISAMIDGAQIGSVTLVNSNQISFTSPAKASGSYTLIVYNPSSDAAAILVPGLIYSGVPTFTTPAGSIGTVYETKAISTSVTATSDSALTYAVTSGSIPTGATFYANGVMTGTAPVDSGSTTYTFAVTATDQELQDTTRTFTLTVNTDVVTWSNPASGSTIALDTSAHSTTLLATSAAGYNVSYAANALPTGLTLTGNTISGTATVEGTSSTLLTATAATSNRSATNTISWVISFGDQYWNYVTTLLSPALPALPFNDDASTNNFAVTINGDTKPNNFNPYTPGRYSVFFDAKTDYISVPATTALTTFTGNFTFEAWVYPTDTSVTYWKIWDSRQNGATAQAMVLGMVPLASPVTGQGRLEYFNGSTYLGTGIVYYNKWTHIAYVRSGTTMTFYVDGIAGGTATISGTQTGSATTNPIWIGTKDNGLASYGTTGYLSNFRIVNGTAVYTANFTPSTEPLTAIANTALLTCQSNNFIDNSTNNYTLTPSSVSISGFDPYLPDSNTSTYGSTYFDGSGDYLRIPNNEALQLTANFTIEFWIYTTSLSSSQRVVVKGNQSSNDYSIDLNTTGTFGLNNGSTVATSTGSIGVNSWNHIALTRNGSTCTWWINGESKGTFTYTNSLNNTSEFWIGQNQSTGLNLVGYLSNFRVVKGTAVYTANFTPPTEPLTAITNTSLLTCQTNQPVNNNMFLDSSTNNSLITRNGNTTQGTFSPYGENWSNYFDGTGDYLTLPTNSAFAIGTADFTVEAWVMPTTANLSWSTIFAGVNFGVSSDWGLYAGDGTTALYPMFFFTSSGTPGNGNSQTQGSQSLTGYTKFTIGQWNHIAVSRVSGTARMFLNGVQTGPSVNASTWSLTNVLQKAIAGGYNGNANTLFTGYISNLNVVSGTGKYTTNFTPSTTPLQPVAGTSLLTCKGPNLVDNSANNFTITKNGDVSVQKFGPFAGTTLPTPYYSGFFDGSSGRLTFTTPTTVGTQIGTGDFTIEAWVYPSNSTVASGYRDVITLTCATNIMLGFNNNILIGYGMIGGNATTTYSPVVGQWQHIAAVRNAGVLKLYANGVEVYSGASTTSFSLSTSGTHAIGSWNTPGEYFPGYISNVRIVYGTAVYTSNFTPPTSPLTAISGTSLLTCQSNTFIDNSTNNFAITAFGNSRPTTFNPFSVTYSTKQSYTPSVFGGSMYFDGTGDYLTAPSTVFDISASTSWTMECWVYPTLGGVEQVLWQNYTTSGTTLFGQALVVQANNTIQFQVWQGSSGAVQFSLISTAININQWNHISVVRNGSLTNNNLLFVNGVLAAQGTWTTHAAPGSTLTYIGVRNYNGIQNPLKGYISDIRVIKGTALYTSNFVPQNKPLIPVQNSTLLLNGTSAGIYDSSEMNNVETVGDAKLSTTTVKFSGTTSMYFDGTGDYLSTPASINYTLGTGNFTIEAWVNYSTKTNSGIFQIGSSIFPGTNGIGAGLDASTNWLLYYNNGSQTAAGTGPTNGVWYHVAVVRNSGTTKMYVNGTQVISVADTATYAGTFLGIAGIYSTSYLMNGYISDFRITKGIARYTTTFTPPTSPFSTK